MVKDMEVFSWREIRDSFAGFRVDFGSRGLGLGVEPEGDVGSRITDYRVDQISYIYGRYM